MTASSKRTGRVKSRPGVHVFTTRLESMGEGDAWSVFRIPFSVEEVFGTRARVSVKGTINGFPFRSSLFPMGDSQHFMMVNQQMWAGAKIKEGRGVEVALQLDTAIRTVEMPHELKTALARNKTARHLFEKLAYSHKREFIRWIEAAKRPETRMQRIRKTVMMIVKGRKQGEKLDDSMDA
jgi:Bacteriocin-protection, YdeI or OmpD-Associated/Domain of unknown function (DUF1905)